MRFSFKVVGVRVEGENVRLLMIPLVKSLDKSNFKISDMLNFNSVVQNIQSQIVQNMPDSISIPYCEWKKKNYNIDDVIVIVFE